MSQSQACGEEAKRKRAALRSIRAAIMAAPNPLSILTQHTPGDEDVSAPNSGVTPFRAAPYPTLVGTAGGETRPQGGQRIAQLKADTGNHCHALIQQHRLRGTQAPLCHVKKSHFSQFCFRIVSIACETVRSNAERLALIRAPNRA